MTHRYRAKQPVFAGNAHCVLVVPGLGNRGVGMPDGNLGSAGRPRGRMQRDRGNRGKWGFAVRFRVVHAGTNQPERTANLERIGSQRDKSQLGRRPGFAQNEAGTIGGRQPFEFPWGGLEMQ